MTAMHPSSNRGIEASNQVKRERREGSREIDGSAMQYILNIKIALNLKTVL